MSAALLELTLTSDPTELPSTRDALRKWLGERGWCAHDVADIVLAVDEALTNVIRHGYKGQVGKPIYLRLAAVLLPGRSEGVDITVRDEAAQVPIDKICGRDLDDLRPGGLGVHIIRNVMEFAEYSHAQGGGMCLTMRKFQRDAQDSAGAKP